ncbi:MAG: cytochrome D1 domain-containing protein [Gammaproteobacteria bacterium]|nr:cytochrome D1 domain-containing protein [Gammaproteobacteria bacterium]
MQVFILICLSLIVLSAAASGLPGCDNQVAIGDRGVVVERATGSVVIVNSTSQEVLCRINGLGDLSHASMVFSRDEQFAYVFGRDGGLSKVDVLNGRLQKRIIQSGNAIGGAITQDGKIIAVSNYEPGGVRLFSAADLKAIASIPANTKQFPDGSKVVGLTDAPGNQLIFSLYNAGEIWQANLDDPAHPVITKYRQIGSLPYDALISPDGRYYMAGLFGEDGIAKLDLWYPEKGVQKILLDYGKGDRKLPVYKMPHLEGWAFANDFVFLPAMGRHQLLVVSKHGWQLAGRIQLLGQPVFAMARPDARQIWVNFAYPDNHWLQVIDTKSLTVVKKLQPGPGVMHMEFTPRGEHVWVSVRDKNQVKIYDTRTFQLLKTLSVEQPSGIFFTARAHQIGL